MLDLERVKFWLDKGAVPSDSVSEILLRLGVKTKHLEEKKQRRARALQLARKQGKPFTKAEKIFVDSPEQAPVEAGDMASAVDRGLLQWSQLLELRHAVAGKIKGRDNDQQIIYAKLMGTGVADVAAAALAYQNAKAAGVGTEMDW